MKYSSVGVSGIKASAVVLGCWRMSEVALDVAAGAIKAALDGGINMFDHADIYGGGESEALFAKAAKKLGVRREEMILQSKCGIGRPDETYDFSKAHILEAVDGSLSRLGTDYLDLLLLHRPDPLMDPAEVAEALTELHNSGKVRAFGVSNFHMMQIELLKKHFHLPLVANQLQFSPAFTGMMDCGVHVNRKTDSAVQRDGMILDYCRLHDITIQAWSPFQYGNIEGIFLGNEQFAPLNAAIHRAAEAHGVSDQVIVVAWILRHPAGMQVLTGSMNAGRIADLATAAEVELSRDEWYDIYGSINQM